MGMWQEDSVLYSQNMKKLIFLNGKMIMQCNTETGMLHWILGKDYTIFCWSSERRYNCKNKSFVLESQ